MRSVKLENGWIRSIKYQMEANNEGLEDKCHWIYFVTSGPLEDGALPLRWYLYYLQLQEARNFSERLKSASQILK